MFQLDLKRIETAIKGGRLDEAFDRMMQSPQRSRHDGQKLIDQLAGALGQRAGEHLADGRLQDAESDVQKAIELAGRKPDLADLRERIVDAIDESSIQRRREDALQQSVKNRIRASDFTLAGQLLPRTSEPDALAETLDHQRMILDDAVTKMERALARNEQNEVVRIARTLRVEWLDHPKIGEHLSAALKPLLEKAMEDLKAGRIDLVGSFLEATTGLEERRSEITELSQTHERCRLAKRAFDQGRWEDMDRELGLLAQMHPTLPWLEETRQSVAETLRFQREIQSGPLGLMTQTQSVKAALRPAPVGDACRVTALPRGVQPHAVQPQSTEPSLILQVDGLGGILLLTKDTVTIGSVSRSAMYDLPLRTDGPNDPLEIRRSGEDYFVQSESEFLVNDQATRRRLLAADETIQFGRRGRIKFRRPVPASGSAVLQLSGAALPRRDIRYVALLSDSLVMASSGGHIAVPDLNTPLILFRDRDGFAIKQTGSQVRENQRLLLGQSLLINGNRFSLRPLTLC
ncbi:MAG: hypothetical protein AAFX06_03665 [Planctomycetota bacterium]